MTELLPQEEAALATAVAKKRAGDAIGAWRLIENIPASSPARFDGRYTEVMSAYSDARTQQIGVEIAGGKGGGPPSAVEKAPSSELPGELSSKQIDRYVNDKRSSLRHECYGERSADVSFHLRLRIDGEGRVAEAALSDVHGDAHVAHCVRDQARTWVFPKSEEGANHPTKFYFGR